MYIACSTLCFGGHPLESALRSIRDMNFSKADLAISESDGGLKPSEILADSNRIMQKLKATTVAFAAFRVTFPVGDSEEHRGQLRAICRLARQMTVPVISVPAAAIGTAIEVEVARLSAWCRIADAEGVILTVETNRGTLTATPAVAKQLCESVPTLGITLDPSHYICSDHGPLEYDELFPFVRHVRLRDSGPQRDAFQVRVGQGELEYGRIINQLDRHQYDRALSVDVQAQLNSPFPVEPEVRKLKYLLESLV
ncbi:MAG: sugar phosphate isomerase/epimerase family protein [Gemmataceae bacterium]